MNKEEILLFLKNHKKELYNDYGVIKIGLFGSFVRNNETEESDIDIAIEIKEEYKTLNNFLSIERFLSDSFHRKVDLGIESSLKPIAKEYIKNEIIYV